MGLIDTFHFISLANIGIREVKNCKQNDVYLYIYLEKLADFC